MILSHKAFLYRGLLSVYFHCCNIMQNSHKDLLSCQKSLTKASSITGQDIISLLRYPSENVATLSFSPSFHCVEEYLRKRDAAHSQNEMLFSVRTEALF